METVNSRCWQNHGSHSWWDFWKRQRTEGYPRKKDMSQRAVQVDMGGVGEWEGQWTDSPSDNS